MTTDSALSAARTSTEASSGLTRQVTTYTPGLENECLRVTSRFSPGAKGSRSLAEIFCWSMYHVTGHACVPPEAKLHTSPVIASEWLKPATARLVRRRDRKSTRLNYSH